MLRETASETARTGQPSHPGPTPPPAPSCSTSRLHVDCDACAVRGPACQDCVISVLLGPPPELIEADERRALEVLAGSGLVPPLRMVRSVSGPEVDSA